MFFFAACSNASAIPGYVGADASTVSPSDNQSLLAPEVNATPTLVPIAAPDYSATISAAESIAENEKQNAYIAQQAAIDARETAIAANVAIIGYTAQAEINHVIIAQITQEAGVRAEAHIYETQTAQPTADAIMATAQFVQMAEIALQAAMLTANSPANIQAVSDAEYSAKFGWINYLAIGLVSISACLFFVWVIVYINDRTKKDADVFASETDEPYIIPMAESADNPNETLRAEIQCTTEQLVALAKGWVEDKKTPAFNKWRGTAVINALYEIRAFLLLHQLAYELEGKNGEQSYTERGRGFMEYTAANGQPPAPFVCVLAPLPSQDELPKNTLVPLTGVPEQV